MIRIVLALSTLMFADSALAQPVLQAHRCDNCSSAAHMEGIAIQHGTGYRYVYSIPASEIRKFWVERYCDGLPPRSADGAARSESDLDYSVCPAWSHFAIEEPVEAAVIEFLGKMKQAYTAYGNSLNGFEVVDYSEISAAISEYGSFPVVRSGEPDAYDFVEHSNTRNSILDVYNTILDQRNNPHTLSWLMRSAVSFTAHGIGINFNLQGAVSLRTRLVFNDGSSVMIQILSNPDRAEYVMGSAVDSTGTPIPDPSYNQTTGVSPGGGSLYGTHDPVSNPERWCQMASSAAGIPCVQGDWGAGGGGTRIVCGRVNGGPIQCNRV